MLEKSNEITAALVLLDKLDIKGGIVTADVSLYFNAQNKKADVWNKANQITTVEKGHGRVETHQYSGIDTTDREMLPTWCALHSVIRVNFIRYLISTGSDHASCDKKIIANCHYFSDRELC